MYNSYNLLAWMIKELYIICLIKVAEVLLRGDEVVIRLSINSKTTGGMLIVFNNILKAARQLASRKL